MLKGVMQFFEDLVDANLMYYHSLNSRMFGEEQK